MPTKVWAVGEEVLAADFNEMVQEQVVATFPNAAARDAAIPAPDAGRMTWQDTPGRFTVWNGTAWVAVRSGILAEARITASSPPIGAAVTDIAGLSITFSVDAGTTYLIDAEVNFQADSAGATAAHLFLRDGASVNWRRVTVGVTSAFVATLHLQHTFTAAASGSQTWKLAGQRIGTSGNIIAAVDTTGYGFIRASAM